MRSVTLSCITFQWMSTRVHWSFRAVGGRTCSPLIVESVISTAVSVIYQKIIPTQPLFAHCPICFRLATLSLCQSIIHFTRRERKPHSPISWTDLMNYALFCAVMSSVSSFICHLHCALAAHLLLS